MHNVFLSFDLFVLINIQIFLNKSSKISYDRKKFWCARQKLLSRFFTKKSYLKIRANQDVCGKISRIIDSRIIRNKEFNNSAIKSSLLFIINDVFTLYY